MIEYLDVLASVVISVGLIKVLPSRWFSRREKIDYEALKRLKAKRLHR